MDTLMAGLFGMANRGKELKVFDWEKAAYEIKDYLEAHKNDDIVIEASLSGDEENTYGDIYSDGEFNLHGYAYLASTWAIPQLVIYNYSSSEPYDEDKDGIKIPCYKMQHEVPEWGAATWCPEVFMDILCLANKEGKR